MIHANRSWATLGYLERDKKSREHTNSRYGTPIELVGGLRVPATLGNPGQPNKPSCGNTLKRNNLWCGYCSHVNDQSRDRRRALLRRNHPKCSSHEVLNEFFPLKRPHALEFTRAMRRNYWNHTATGSTITIMDFFTRAVISTSNSGFTCAEPNIGMVRCALSKPAVAKRITAIEISSYVHHHSYLFVTWWLQSANLLATYIREHF